MNIPDETVEAIHGAICEESLEDHMDPAWPGRCVKAAKAAAPLIAAAEADAIADYLDKMAALTDGPNIQSLSDHAHALTIRARAMSHRRGNQ